MNFKSGLKEVIFQKLVLFFPKKNHYSLDSQIGICALLCHRDVTMFIYNLHSLFFFLGRQFPVYVINDGSLTKNDKKKLTTHFVITIEEPEFASARMKEKLRPYPSIYEHRFIKNIANYRLKLDVLLLNPFKKYIMLDADILFLKKPVEIERWINSSKKTNYYTAHTESFYTDDFYAEFSFRKLLYLHLKISMSAGFSSGTFLIANNSFLNLRKMEKLFEIYKKISALGSEALEENAFSILAAQNNFQCLPLDKYVVLSMWSEYENWKHRKTSTSMIHYGWETKERFSAHAIRLALSHNFFYKIKQKIS